MFCTGLPVLYPFAAVFFFAYYWVYKYLLIKFYARSRSFNEDIPMVATSFFTLGVILHLILGALMISNSNILTTSKTIRSYKDSGMEVVKYVLERVNSFSIASAFFVFSIILCIIISVKNCCLGLAMRMCARCCEASKSFLCCKVDPTLNQEVSANFYEELSPAGLRSIYEKALIELDEIEKVKDKINSPSFNDLRYSEEAPISYLSIKSQLEQRVSDIEFAIDSHLKHIHGMKRMSYFENLSYMVKLRYLFEMVLYVDEELRMRINDTIQSYNNFESPDYYRIKSV